jgi:hypothetical protein
MTAVGAHRDRIQVTGPGRLVEVGIEDQLQVACRLEKVRRMPRG